MEAAPALVAALVGLAVVLTVAGLSNQAQFDSQEQTVVTDGPATAGVERMSRAIAQAEGFYVAGSIPARANNPGDIKVPNWSGAKLGEGISVFPTIGEGWSRLYRQLNLIASGQSRVYTLGDSIASMSVKWTGSDNAAAWASIVASALGTETDALLAEVLV